MDELYLFHRELILNDIRDNDDECGFIVEAINNLDENDIEILELLHYILYDNYDMKIEYIKELYEMKYGTKLDSIKINGFKSYFELIDNLDKYTNNTICFKTMENNSPIKPDCIICFDDVNDYILNVSHKFNQKILVLKRNPNTIENNEMDDYHGHGEVQ